jgi:hypothetical protein
MVEACFGVEAPSCVAVSGRPGTRYGRGTIGRVGVLLRELPGRIPERNDRSLGIGELVGDGARIVE